MKTGKNWAIAAQAGYNILCLWEPSPHHHHGVHIHVYRLVHCTKPKAELPGSIWYKDRYARGSIYNDGIT